jgi:hypothetical protein
MAKNEPQDLAAGNRVLSRRIFLEASTRSNRST